MLKKNTRDNLIETTALLLQNKGYIGTGMNDIIKKSGSPKGSVYYYFPGGKEQLAVEAIKWTTKLVIKIAREELAIYDNPTKAISNFIIESANRFDQGTYIYGAPISVIALEMSSESEIIREACKDFFKELSEELTNKLKLGGYEEYKAKEYGEVINALIQGAFVVSVSYKNSSTFKDIANNISIILQS